MPYVVHLEDNEHYLVETITGMSLEELRRLPLQSAGPAGAA